VSMSHKDQFAARLQVIFAYYASFDPDKPARVASELAMARLEQVLSHDRKFKLWGGLPKTDARSAVL